MLGFGRRAVSSVVGSLRGRYGTGLNQPPRFIPSIPFSTNGEDDVVHRRKGKGQKPRRTERDEMIVFVLVPPPEPKNKAIVESACNLKRKDGKGRTCDDSPEISVKPGRMKKTRSSVNVEKPKTETLKTEKMEKVEKVEKVKRKKGKNKKDQSSEGTVGVNSSEGTVNCPETITTGAKKKRTRKKKNLKQTDDDIKNLLIGPFVPFEGTFMGPAEEQGSQGFSMDRQDTPEGRFYHLTNSTSSFSFPSVTTVIDNTVEGSSYYRLLNWRLKLTGEHGEKGFDTIRRTTLDSGHSFHKKLESRLQRLKSLKESSTKGMPKMGVAPRNPVEDKIQVQNRVDSTAPPVSVTERCHKEPVGKNPQTVRSDATSDMPAASALRSSPASDSSVVSPTIGDENSVIFSNTEEVDEEISLDISGNEDDHQSLSKSMLSDPMHMQSVEHILADIGEIKALETSVAHMQLGYMGTFDCLAEYKGTLCLIDWKTSNKPKPTLADCYDYPLQAVAYAGAVNQDPRLNLKVLNVLIVIAYGDGEPAHAHFINSDLCQKYWLKWLQRLQKYQTRFSEDLSEIVN